MAANGIKIYSSYSRGLDMSSEALHTLKSAGFDGIESDRIGPEVKRTLDAGLEISCHNPGGVISLADPDMMSGLDGNSRRLSDVIGASGPPLWSLHCGYSYPHVIKRYGFHDLMVYGLPITDREELLDRAAGNLALLRERFGPLAIEGIAFHMPGPLVRSPGRLNAGKDFVTEHDFLTELSDRSGAWLLLDIAHNSIASHTMNNRGHAPSEGGDVIGLYGGRVLAMHVNLPLDCGEYGLLDEHIQFDGRSYLDGHVIEMAQEALIQCPNMCYIVPEVDTHKPPVEHARIMAGQLDYTVRKLGL